MATYVKGNPVENATSYELFEKVGSAYNSLKTGNAINFNLDELGLADGNHTLVVKAKADGYEDSDYSNEVLYAVDSDPATGELLYSYNTDTKRMSTTHTYVGACNQTVPANTYISKVLVAVGCHAEDFDFYVINADTNAVVECLMDSQAQESVKDDSIGEYVLTVDINKSYSHPIYFVSSVTGNGNSGSQLILEGACSNTQGYVASSKDTKLSVGTVLTLNSTFGFRHYIYG